MKQTFQYSKIPCKVPLNHIHTARLPFHWDLNVYRGCEHQCAYCYALYSHRYLEDADFYHHIYVKERIVEQLEKKLSSKTWKREAINLGGITDSYQSVEAVFQIMPEIWKLLIKYKTPAIISTKSTLILRDIEYIRKLSKVAYVNVAFTITTMNEGIRSVLEANASPSKERFCALKQLKAAGAIVGVHFMPMIPYLTATKSNMETIFRIAALCQVDYILPGMLSLRGTTKTNFYQFLKENYPELHPKIYYLYHNKEAKMKYKKELYQVIHNLCQKYHLNTDYRKAIASYDNSVTQLSIFEISREDR